jgi:hypothetical protein
MPREIVQAFQGWCWFVSITLGGAPRLRRVAYPGLCCVTPLGSSDRNSGSFRITTAAAGAVLESNIVCHRWLSLPVPLFALNQ